MSKWQQQQQARQKWQLHGTNICWVERRTHKPHRTATTPPPYAQVWVKKAVTSIRRPSSKQRALHKRAKLMRRDARLLISPLLLHFPLLCLCLLAGWLAAAACLHLLPRSGCRTIAAVAAATTTTQSTSLHHHHHQQQSSSSSTATIIIIVVEVVAVTSCEGCENGYTGWCLKSCPRYHPVARCVTRCC